MSSNLTNKNNNISDLDSSDGEILVTLSAQIQSSALLISTADKIIFLNDAQAASDIIFKKFFDTLVKYIETPDYYNDKSKVLLNTSVIQVLKKIITKKLISKGEHLNSWMKIFTTNLPEAIKLLQIFAECEGCEGCEGCMFHSLETLTILQSLSRHTYYLHNLKAIFEKYDVFEYDMRVLEIASQHNFKVFLTRAINNKYVFNDECINNIIKNDNVDLYKITINDIFPMSENSLFTACKYGSVNIIKHLLDSKIEPTKRCMTESIMYTNMYTNIPDYTTRKNVVTNNTNKTMINMLKSYGYVITYDDVILATEKKIVIDDFESLGIKLDVKFLELCTELSFYPYKTTELKPNQVCLEKECKKSGNISAIKKLITQGVEPTQKCIQHACAFKNNLQTISYLVSKGLIIDKQCFKSICTTLCNNTLTFVVDEFFKNLENQKNLEDQKIIDDKKLKNTMTTVDKNVTNKQNTNTINNIMQATNEPLDSDDEVLIKKSSKTKKSLKDAKDDTKDGQKTIKKLKKSKTTNASDEKPKSSKKKKLLKEDSENSDVDITNTNTKTDTKIIVNTFVLPPENYNYRVDREIDSDVIKLLSLKPKSTHSFLAIRKHLLTYLTTNKLIKDDTIKLNKELSNLIKKSESDVLNLTDIEKITYSLVKNAKEIDVISSNEKIEK